MRVNNLTKYSKKHRESTKGIFEKYKPEVIFGLHVTNIPNGVLLVKPGPAMAAASAYRIKVKGLQTL